LVFQGEQICPCGLNQRPIFYLTAVVEEQPSNASLMNENSKLLKTFPRILVYAVEGEMLFRIMPSLIVLKFALP